MSPSLCFLFLAIFLKNLVKSNLALPDCHQRQCGKITVPDPFAIGKGCGINPDLELLCDQLSDHPVLKLANSPEMEVTQISISPQTLKPNTHGLLHGCTSYCSRESSTVQSQCSGHGCCQTTLPDGVSESYSWRINTLNTERRQSSIKSWCSYGMIVSDDFTDFKELRKIDSQYHSLLVPAELDWIVKNTTCTEAMKNEATFACKDENSKCIDTPKGYSCICHKGYEGTPFELHGCKKTDICRDPDQNPCVKSSTCLKKRDGVYLCSCPFFYFGDGKKEGSGCHFGYHIILIVLVSIKVAVVLYFFISYMIK